MLLSGLGGVFRAAFSAPMKRCCASAGVKSSFCCFGIAVSSDRIEKILSLVGRMCLEWNEVEVGWFLIYTILVHHLPRSVAEAIFKRNTTGYGQRDLIIAIADVALADSKYASILRYLNAAKNETNNLALERNDIVHGDYHYVVDLDLQPDEATVVQLGPGNDKARRANIFAGKDLETNLPPLIADIARLRRQIKEAGHHLIWSYLPADKRSEPIDQLPPDMQQWLLATRPELTPPATALIWSPIRPIARTQR
jgi:hypothetical protein